MTYCNQIRAEENPKPLKFKVCNAIKYINRYFDYTIQ